MAVRTGSSKQNVPTSYATGYFSEDVSDLLASLFLRQDQRASHMDDECSEVHLSHGQCITS